jgi:hypothetical protein
MLKREICMISTVKKAYVMEASLQVSEISLIFSAWEAVVKLAPRKGKLSQSVKLSKSL